MTISKDTFYPAEGYYLIQTKAEEEKLESGIILSTESSPAPSYGKVIVKNNNLEYKRDNIKVGDIVFFKKYSGVDLTLRAEEYTVLHESDIIGYVKS